MKHRKNTIFSVGLVAVGLVVGCGGSGATDGSATTDDAAGNGGSAGTKVAGSGGSSAAGKTADGGSGGAKSAGAAAIAGSGGTTDVAGAGGDASAGNGDGGAAGGNEGGATGEGGSGGDAGSAGAPMGPITPIGDCTAAPADVYVTPTLATFDPSVRGDIVRCAADGALTEDAVQQELNDKSLPDVIATTGLRFYRISYRTERADDVAGVSTARVYLPDTPHASPMPIVLIGHPSEGLADTCAPSMDDTSLRDLALPWAARGYAVIAPDYAGLGNEGTQGYLDNKDQAHSLLDGARALRKLVPSGFLSSKIVIFGHSQGGGATLSAQALAGTYGADGDVAAVAVFAPQWPTRLNSFDFVNLLNHPSELTIFSSITDPVVVQLLTLAYARNYGISTSDVFPANLASGVEGAADSLCLQEFGAYVQAKSAKLGDLTNADMRAAFLACVSDATSAGCTGVGKGLYDFMNGNILHGDPKGGPILYVQGLLDTIMPPASEAACNLAFLAKDGVTPQVCTDQTGIHTNVVVNNIVFAMSWAEAIIAGTAAPTCDDSGMPSCNP